MLKGVTNIEIIDEKEYREVTLCGRTKLIAKDGSAINPIRRKQKATIHINHDGYPCFGGGVPVHLYVANGWVEGYFEGAEVNHKDFNRMNYHADNLEWVTHTDNIKYTIENNNEIWLKSKQGIKNGRATFTEDKVREIRKLFKQGLSIADILRIDYPDYHTQKQYHAIHSTYANICHYKTWKNLKDIS